MVDTCTHTLYSFVRRDDAFSEFLKIVQSPFQQNFSTNTFLASLGISVGSSALIILLWCFVRPYHSVVYAPKVRVADEKHALPPIGKHLFSWIKPLMKCHEPDLVDRIGLDAVIFLRFMRFARLLFFVLGVLGCFVVIPVNVTCNLKAAVPPTGIWKEQWYALMSPYWMSGSCMWAHIIVAWVFDFIILYFLWVNYRAVLKLRWDYFESPEYVNSLNSRSLMITDVPKQDRSDGGLEKIIAKLPIPGNGEEKCSIGRNVKELPKLVAKHRETVQKLEQVLSKYLKNPDKLPARPICYPDKDDKLMPQKSKVDAIEYYKSRMHEMEQRIITVRATIDKRDAMPYGFVSYPTISRTHIIAKAARGKHPKGTSIKLAPKPSDIIWRNMERRKSTRGWNGFVGHVLFVALSILYVAPNALIAVFLSNFNNIALVWTQFGNIRNENPQFWAGLQAILAPTVTTIIYLLLPVLMRKISIYQGDLTKSARERHVTGKLYFFFVFNNLIVFTLFGTTWTIVSAFVNWAQDDGVTWAKIRSFNIRDRMSVSIFQISTFWITYLLQRNLGAVIDLAQVVSLVGKSFAVRFMSPTPRERIEWTAPPTFDYATYYNLFLYYITIALCFSTIQPLVLPITFVYFLFDSFLKKYILMYIFITKNESGGTFWRMLCNRVLFGTALFNLVVGLVVWARFKMSAAACIIPLFIIMIFFKVYCYRTFDMKFRYHTKGPDHDSITRTGQSKLHNSLDKRYGHPVLHEPLLKPLISGKASHLAVELLGGKSAVVGNGKHGVYAMEPMQRGAPGRKAPSDQGFEVVQEEDMDFSNFKNRPEFAEDHGGGVIYDTQSERSWTPSSSRPGSPTFSTAGSRYGSSPLAGGGYRGTDYVPVANPGLPAPSERLHPDSPYGDIGSITDEHDRESVRGLLLESQRPGASSPRLQPYGNTQWERHQPYDSYDDVRESSHQ